MSDDDITPQIADSTRAFVGHTLTIRPPTSTAAAQLTPDTENQTKTWAYGPARPTLIGQKFRAATLASFQQRAKE